ncbi:MAG: SLC13 family permease, partial [Bacteroidales bacterium]|nr:SLC13 family permease [Bacteroidales bacterium]
KPLGRYGALYGIYIITALLAAFITNKAAVAIVFPIALSVSIQMGLNPTPFILIVSFAAAANFMTPVGYQTNLMIYGPGGYKFVDFLKVGTPLTLIYMLVAVTILSYIYF